MPDSIYKTFIEAKNSSLIPQLQNGKTLESKYNPQKESLKICEDLKSRLIQNNTGSKAFNEKDFYFFIVLGISSGILIQEIANQYPNCRILGIERNEEDLLFLQNSTIIQELKKNERIIFCDIHNLAETLTSFYLPAKYKKPEIVELKAWLVENSDKVEEIQSQINKGVRIISADYSVQAHFGKIWMHNILGNLKNLSTFIIDDKKKTELSTIIDRNKTALIVAAGPSLENKIAEINKNRHKYFIISTDTGSKILEGKSIVSDAVISIDGQNISYNHFFGKIHKSCLYFFDLCSSPSAAEFVSKNGGNLHYFTSGHPFAELACNFNRNSFPHIFSGAGTVTIAAVDLAEKLGFSKIKVVGADFAYSKGKAYARGTYLEDIYSKKQSKIETIEKKYDNLLFRTPLLYAENKITTEILNAYKTSFLEYIKVHNFNYEIKDNEYLLWKKNNVKEKIKDCQEFPFKAFLEYCAKCSLKDLEIALLPYVAFLKNAGKEKGDYYLYLEEAKNFINDYNERNEK